MEKEECALTKVPVWPALEIFAAKAIFIGDDIFSKVAAQGMRPTDKGLS
jgi:hypothetical protein